MIDSARQRLNMVESQIRPSDVTDRRILRAMSEVAREAFVPQAVASLAYMDEPVVLEANTSKPAAMRRTLMPPRSFAKLVQLASIEPSDRVLIVGAGRGYSAAIIARLAATVVALESDETLAAAAKGALAGLENVSVVTGPLPEGRATAPAFDAVIVEGMVWERPLKLLSQLKDGGRLAAVLQTGGVGQATLWTRVGDHHAQTIAFEAQASPLPGFERPKAFVF